MPGRQKLVLMVEGDGDAAAAPILIKNLLTVCGGSDSFQFDPADTIHVSH